MKEELKKLLTTLNQIEVKGEANLNRLLGCIQFVQGMINNLRTNEAVPPNMTHTESGWRTDDTEDK